MGSLLKSPDAYLTGPKGHPQPPGLSTQPEGQASSKQPLKKRAVGARLSPGGTFVPAARTGPHTQEVPDPAPPHRRKTGTGEDGLGTRSPTRLLAANAPARYPFSCGETKAGRPPPAGTYRTGRGHGRAGAPEAPEESVAAAAAVAARSVSAPPMAANSNAGRVPAPRPPRLKERRCLGSLLPDRK